MDLTSPLMIGAVQTSPLELIAVAFGLLYVWYMRKESTLAYPFGIINVLIYVYICYSTRLYAYAAINFFYFLMSVYGWYNWTKGTVGEKLTTSWCTKRELAVNGFAIPLFFFILWALLSRFTDSTVPVWDALTTSIYIIGMWLLALKKIENWLLWIAGDTISIGLFAHEKLWFSSFQFLVFTVMAVLGFLEWKRKLELKNHV